MIPKKFEPIVFGFLLSGMMSFVVSGIATLRAVGLIEGFVPVWLSAWVPSWGVAFPTVLVVAPIARRFVAKLVSAS